MSCKTDDDETEDESSQEFCGYAKAKQEESSINPRQTESTKSKDDKDVDKKSKKPEWIKKGVKCMALYTRDNIFYRAVIDGILSEDEVEVTFIGFESEGKEQVPFKHLKRVPQRIIQTKTVDNLSKSTDQTQMLASESFFTHLEGFEMKEEIRTKYENEDFGDSDFKISDMKQNKKQGKKIKGSLDISTCKGSKVLRKRQQKKEAQSLEDPEYKIVDREMDIKCTKRSISKRKLSSPKQDEWCDLDGFDDQDMEKPHFSEPAPSPFVPLVLSEPGKQPLIQVPATINCRLREYQRDGVKFLYQHYHDNKGAILGDDMGLGKTVQVIAFLAAVLGKTGTKVDVFGKYMNRSKSGEKEKTAVKQCFLVVSPGSVLYNWHDELETWGHFKVRLYHGNNKETILEEAVKRKLDVVLTTYDTLRINVKKVNKVCWSAVIMDEVHKLKDPDAQITVAAKSLKVKRRFGLTGTPLQNRFDEFWSVLDWANPGCLGSARKFTKEYSRPVKKGQRYDVTKRELAIGRTISKNFQSKLHGQWFLRRTKDLISDQLPQKDERIVFCNLTSFQEDVYVTLLQSPDVQLITKKDNPCDCGSGMTRGHCCYTSDENGESLRSLLMRYLHLLLKAANHTALLMPQVKQTQDQRIKAKAICDKVFARHPEYAEALTDSSFQTLSDPSYCGKMKVLDLILRMFEKEKSKVLLFSQSTRLLDILEEYVIGRGMIYSRLDGKTKTSLRPVIVREFNNNPEIFVCLVSTKAGALGLNFTGANVVIIFDPTWNPANDLQAQDRAYRIGQRRDVQIFRLISSGTVEEMIYLRQVYKQQMANIAVKGTNERRYFTGVEGEKDLKGELFGMENLFSYRAEGVSLAHDIIQRTDKLEAGLRIEKYKIVASGNDEDVDVTNENKASADASEDEDDYDLEEMASQYFNEKWDAQTRNIDEPSTSGINLANYKQTSLSDDGLSLDRVQINSIEPSESSDSVQKGVRSMKTDKAKVGAVHAKKDRRKARLNKYVSEFFSCSETTDSDMSEKIEYEDRRDKGEGSLRKTGRQEEFDSEMDVEETDDGMTRLGQTDKLGQTPKQTNNSGRTDKSGQTDKSGRKRQQTNKFGQTDRLGKQRGKKDKVNKILNEEDKMLDTDSEDSETFISYDSRQRFTKIRDKKRTNQQTRRNVREKEQNENEMKSKEMRIRKARKALPEPISRDDKIDRKSGRQKYGSEDSLSKGRFDGDEEGCHGNAGYLSMSADESLEFDREEDLLLVTRLVPQGASKSEREDHSARLKNSVPKVTTAKAQEIDSKKNKVEEILSKCGVNYTHANRSVVRTSKAESHMTKRAIQDVFELRQFSQQPANCFAAFEVSEESDDVAEFTTCQSKSKEKDAKKRKNSKTDQETQSTATRSKAASSPNKVINGTTEVIDSATVIIGGTPRGIRRKHFSEMCRYFGFASEVDFALSVTKETAEDRKELVKTFYCKTNPDFLGLKYFSGERVEETTLSKREKKRSKMTAAKTIVTKRKENTKSVGKTVCRLAVKKNLKKRMTRVGREKYKRKGVVFDDDGDGYADRTCGIQEANGRIQRKRPYAGDDDEDDDDHITRKNKLRKSRKRKERNDDVTDETDDDDGDDDGDVDGDANVNANEDLDDDDDDDDDDDVDGDGDDNANADDDDEDGEDEGGSVGGARAVGGYRGEIMAREQIEISRNITDHDDKTNNESRKYMKDEIAEQDVTAVPKPSSDRILNSKRLLQTCRQKEASSFSILDEFFAPKREQKTRKTNTASSVVQPSPWRQEVTVTQQDFLPSVEEKQGNLHNNIQDNKHRVLKKSILDDFI